MPDLTENQNPPLPEDSESQLDFLIGDSTESTNSETTTPQNAISEQWPTSPLAAQISSQVMMVINTKVAPNWNLSEAEQAMISAPLAQIITAWLPTSPDQQMNPYIAFLGGCALVAGGRVVADIPMQKPEKLQKEESNE